MSAGSNIAWRSAEKSFLERAHDMTHRGRFYTASRIYPGVVNTATAILWCQPGSNFELHSVWAIDAGGEVQHRLYKDVTGLSGGTALPAFNMNDTSPNTTEAVFTHTPAGVLSGTQIREILIPGSAFFSGAARGAPVRPGSEYVMRPSGAYVIEVTNTSGVTVDISIEIGYYEED